MPCTHRHSVRLTATLTLLPAYRDPRSDAAPAASASTTASASIAKSSNAFDQWAYEVWTRPARAGTRDRQEPTSQSTAPSASNACANAGRQAARPRMGRLPDLEDGPGRPMASSCVRGCRSRFGRESQGDAALSRRARPAAVIFDGRDVDGWARRKTHGCFHPWTASISSANPPAACGRPPIRRGCR